MSIPFKLIKPSIEFLWMTSNPLETIEQAGRTCYKSEDKIDEGSAKKFVQKLISNGHFAMIEHASASYRVICDRGCTHEIVRHRLFSYAQESTRYCNYSKRPIQFIIPCWFQSEWTEVEFHDIFYNPKIQSPKESAEFQWLIHMQICANAYNQLLENGWVPQQARSVLPNSLKTEIVITGNFREWLHFFKLRCAKTAHPQMQEIANMIRDDFKMRVPDLTDYLYFE
jgi:thymidylate synthase (FAD)